MGADSVIMNVQSLLLLALGLAALGLEVWALVDAVRYPTAAYPAAGKLTKPAWLGILGVALAIGVITVFNVMSGFGIIGVVAAGVYLADVRPALRSIAPRRRRGGGASGSGPYGAW